MSCKRQQDPVYEDDVLKVVDDAFAVQKVHGDSQEVPIQCLCEPQASRSTWNVRYGNHLFEGQYLDCRNDHDNVDVAGEHGCKEAGDHDKGPDCSCDEGLLLLFILGLLWVFFFDFLSLHSSMLHCERTNVALPRLSYWRHCSVLD